jgi:hypothetical protein
MVTLLDGIPVEMVKRLGAVPSVSTV